MLVVDNLDIREPLHILLQVLSKALTIVKEPFAVFLILFLDRNSAGLGFLA